MSSAILSLRGGNSLPSESSDNFRLFAISIKYILLRNDNIFSQGVLNAESVFSEGFFFYGLNNLLSVFWTERVFSGPFEPKKSFDRILDQKSLFGPSSAQKNLSAYYIDDIFSWRLLNAEFIFSEVIFSSQACQKAVSLIYW